MYGVIHLWKVKPDKLAEHLDVMWQTLAVERERCPEVLLNVTLGPAADGTCAEVQVYADKAANRDFGGRVEREDAELRSLWQRFGDLCYPGEWRTLRFEEMAFLDASFFRAAAGVRCAEVPETES